MVYNKKSFSNHGTQSVDALHILRTMTWFIRALTEHETREKRVCIKFPHLTAEVLYEFPQ